MVRKIISFKRRDGSIVRFKGKAKKASTAKSAAHLTKKMSAKGMHPKMISRAVRKFKNARS